MLAGDFLTVDTLWLPRLYVLVFLSIAAAEARTWPAPATRTRHGCCSRRATLLIDLDDRGRQMRFLIHDRDSKFSAAFDA